MHDLELRRAVWRHEYGYPGNAKDELSGQFAAAAREFAELRGRAAVVREREPELLPAYDEFRTRADRALKREHYRQALGEILHGRRVIDAIRALLKAHDAIHVAAAAVAALHASAGVPRIRALPSFTAPHALLALARARMDERRYAPADHLAREVVRQAAPLQACEALAPAPAAELDRRFTAIESLCGETRGVLDDPDADLHADGTMATLRHLARRGFGALARRVADELEVSLSTRGQFLRELRRCGDTADALRGGVVHAPGDDVWTAATRHLWRTRLAFGAAPAAAARPAPAPATPAGETTGGERSESRSDPSIAQPTSAFAPPPEPAPTEDDPERAADAPATHEGLRREQVEQERERKATFEREQEDDLRREAAAEQQGPPAASAPGTPQAAAYPVAGGARPDEDHPETFISARRS
jgi:hypothetical protein